jgi:tetratricopeptide (TPR) repeat protein
MGKLDMKTKVKATLIVWSLALSFLAPSYVLAAYPQGGRYLREMTQKTILSGYEGQARPFLIQSLPDFYGDFVSRLKEKGYWDNPQALEAIISPYREEFNDSYNISTDPNIQSSMHTFLNVVGIRERIGQMRNLSLEEKLWLYKAYRNLAFLNSLVQASSFIKKFSFEFLASEKRQSDADRFNNTIKWVEALSGGARKAFLETAHHLLNQPGMDLNTTVYVLAGIDPILGTAPVIRLQAQQLLLSLEPTPERKNKFIRLALEHRYYQVAEKVWNFMTIEDKAENSFKVTSDIRRKTIELESFAGQTSYQARLQRALLMVDINRSHEAEPILRELIEENDQQILAWSGLAKAIWQGDVFDYTAVRDVLNQALVRLKSRNADLLEMKIVVEFISFLQNETNTVENMQKKLNAINKLNSEYHHFKPLKAELVSIWLDFMKNMLPNNEMAFSNTYLKGLYDRVQNVLKQQPDHFPALSVELLLAARALGFHQSFWVVTKPTPKTLSGPERIHLLTEKAKYLMEAFWYKRDFKFLQEANQIIALLENENIEADNLEEIEQIANYASILNSLQDKQAEPGNFKQALVYFQNTLLKCKDKELPLLLNNILFLQIYLKRYKQVAETLGRILRLNTDDTASTLLLANRIWFYKHINKSDIAPEKVVAAIRAKNGSQEFCALMVLAGQIAFEQGNEEKQQALWLKSLKGMQLCPKCITPRLCYCPGPVFINNHLTWGLTYSSKEGLLMPIQPDMHLWLLHSYGQGKDLTLWPTVDELKAVHPN